MSGSTATAAAFKREAGNTREPEKGDARVLPFPCQVEDSKLYVVKNLRDLSKATCLSVGALRQKGIGTGSILACTNSAHYNSVTGTRILNLVAGVSGAEIAPETLQRGVRVTGTSMRIKTKETNNGLALAVNGKEVPFLNLCGMSKFKPAAPDVL